VELGLVEGSGDEQLLSSQQRRRYDRQLIYFSDLAAPGTSGEALQRRLGDAKVVILGCGGLGSWAACGLACAGVGSLVLIDDDRVELSNLNRQILFAEAELGQPKVDAAARTLAAYNSELKLAPVRRRVRGPSDLADVLDGADLLIATADWPPYELQRWVNRACLDAGVAYISAGQFPPLVRVGPMVLPGSSACQECLERQTRRGFPMYDEVTAEISKKPPRAATLGAASGVVGSMLAMEAVHLLTDASRPASVDTALILDLRTMRLSKERVRRDPACPECGSGEAPDLPPLRSKDEQTLDRSLGWCL
jgi:bacteriocin biosynthesis cyclodehydratase domain-containing protein